jgi:hypothetical protein
MSEPPSLQGRDRIVFIVAALLVVIIQISLLLHLQGGEGPVATPEQPAPPPPHLGTVDPAGILWLAGRDDGIAPMRSEVPADVSFRIFVRNVGKEGHTFVLRPQSGGAPLATWNPGPGQQQERPVRLAPGSYVVEDSAAPSHACAIEAELSVPGGR